MQIKKAIKHFTDFACAVLFQIMIAQSNCLRFSGTGTVKGVKASSHAKVPERRLAFYCKKEFLFVYLLLHRYLCAYM